MKRFLLFHFFFYTSQGIIRIVHPLFWALEGREDLFFLTYFTMTLVANAGFFFGKLCDRFSLFYLLRIAVFLYALAIFLRLFSPTPLTATLSGILAGIGLSLTSTATRPWIKSSIKKECEIARAVSWQRIAGTFGTIFGRGLCMLLPLLLFTRESTRYSALIAIATLLCAATFFAAPKKEEKAPPLGKEQPFGKKKIFRELFLCCVLSFSFGSYLSGIDQNLVLFMKDRAFSLESIGFFLGVAEAIRALIEGLSGYWMRRKSSEKIYIVSCFLLCLSTFFLTIPFAPTPFVIFLFVQTALYSLSYVAKEIYFLQKLPPALGGNFSGWIQTSYYLGLTLGCLFTLIFHQLFTTVFLLRILASMLLIFPATLLILRKTSQKEEVVN